MAIKESEIKTEEDLIAHADKNLYLAKENGRNRCWTDHDTLKAEGHRTEGVEQELVES